MMRSLVCYGCSRWTGTGVNRDRDTRWFGIVMYEDLDGSVDVEPIDEGTTNPSIQKEI